MHISLDSTKYECKNVQTQKEMNFKTTQGGVLS